MAGANFPELMPDSSRSAGWLIVREDGVIVAADERAITLLDAVAAGTLLGRAWPSLVSASEGQLLAMAVSAFERGEAWSGVLSFQFAEEPRLLAVSLVPRTPGRGEVAVINLAPVAITDEATPPQAVGPAEARDDLEVLVDAIEASAELHDPQAIARAVLQAIRPAIRFEWAVVLRLFHHEHFGTPPAAEVVATYPTGLAGVDAGAAWIPIDRAEQAVLEAGEPSLDGQLARDDEDRSPLRRLPAFGMRSRLFVPLFAPAGAGVNGGVALYSTQPMAFSPADGLRLERFVRRLGSFVGPAVELASRNEASLPAAGEPVAPPETNEPREPDANSEMERLADFAAGVAHELNNPLAAVLGYAQLLPQLSEKERGPALSAIEAETLRASEVTRDLLAFARQQPPAMRDVRLDGVVSRVLDVLRHDLDGAGIELVTMLASPPPLQADEPQLEQAVLHLLRNALEAMPQGGRLTVETRALGKVVRLEVSDSGTGVARDIAGRIFEPFVTSYIDSEHRGMGLAIVHGVAGAHGGRVWFEDLEPSGTRFVLELPVVDGSAAS